MILQSYQFIRLFFRRNVRLQALAFCKKSRPSIKLPVGYMHFSLWLNLIFRHFCWSFDELRVAISFECTFFQYEKYINLEAVFTNEASLTMLEPSLKMSVLPLCFDFVLRLRVRTVAWPNKRVGNSNQNTTKYETKEPN